MKRGEMDEDGKEEKSFFLINLLFFDMNMKLFLFFIVLKCFYFIILYHFGSQKKSHSENKNHVQNAIYGK